MTKRASRIALCLAALVVLSGCGITDSVSDLTAGWFSSAKKSNIKGTRISIMALDESLKPDPTLADTPVVLPPPYRNPEWPEPGGYASNAMYHLEASGPLVTAWQQDAGKGSDSESRLTAAPVVANGRVFVLDSESHVFAYDAKSGTPVWDKELAPKGGEGGFWNTASFGLFGQDTTIDPSKGFGGGVAFEDRASGAFDLGGEC